MVMSLPGVVFSIT